MASPATIPDGPQYINHIAHPRKYPISPHQQRNLPERHKGQWRKPDTQPPENTQQRRSIITPPHLLLSIRAIARAFCSKVTGAPPFHDVNVTQLIVIDYYYHTVIMLSCTCTLIKERENRRLAEQPIRSSSSMAAIRFCSAMYSRMRFLSGWPAWSRISPSFTGDFPAHFIPPCSSGRFDHVMGKHIAALELLTSCLNGHGTGIMLPFHGLAHKIPD